MVEETETMMSIDERHRAHTGDHLGTLLSEAGQQASRLAHDELRMLRAEIAENRRTLGFGGGLIGGAGVLAFIAIQAIAAAVIAALAVALPVWAAALIVGVAAGLAAGVAALLGKKQVQRAAPAVSETVSSVKADLSAIKDGELR